MNSSVYQRGFLVLFLLSRALVYEIEKYDLYAGANDFENDTIENSNATNIADEASDNYDNFSMYAFSIVSVSPGEVVIDTKSELQLSVSSFIDINTSSILCFVSTPDNDLEILSSYWISNTQLNCSGFEPVVSGFFFINVNFSNVRTTYNKKVTVKVISKHPIAERAEYKYDFDKIFIYFDTNIKLYSNCASTFSEKALNYFGAGFNCAVTGNILIVKMGDNFKLMTEIEIIAGNKICRSDSKKEFCLYAKPGNLKVVKPKVAGPIISLFTTSECMGNNASQKYVNLKITANNQKQSFDEVFLTTNVKKNQRKNLIMWRTWRRIQSKISSNLTFKIDKSDMQPLYENLESVENFLANGNIQSVIFRTGVTVSVSVQAPHIAGTILAEANVEFCKNFNQLFRYKWILNEKTISEENKLLKVQNAIPGKYVIKCYILAYNSSDILGQGWTTTEVLDSKPQVIVYPLETITGSTENISLHVVVWHSETISWVCRTNIGKVCFTNTQKLISDILDMKSYNIIIPSGILPPGEYIWTVENTQGVNTAKIIIKLENTVALNVKLDSVIVEEFQKIILRGAVKRWQNKCRLWWNSFRQKGFNYINLHKSNIKTEVLVQGGQMQRQIILEFPRSLENWKGLQPNSLYMFRLSAFCPHSVSYEYIKIPISVNGPPRLSQIKVEPRKGLAMTTNFIISKIEADDSIEDYPLLFEWSYLDTCGIEIPITKGVYSREITIFLPPGDIKVILTVCDVKKACAKVSSSVIDVSHSKIIRENFYNAANQIYYLIVSRDDVEAFGLAMTVFKSLALKAETEIRYSVFTSIEEGIYIRIKQFNQSIENTSKSIKSYLDFVDRALIVARYFPKRSNISQFLKDFRNFVSKKEKNLKNHFERMTERERSSSDVY